MSQFSDSLGRKWSFEISTQSVKLLRKELGVDILSLANKPQPGAAGLLQQLASDEVLLVDVISVLLSDEITKKGLSEHEFALGLVGQGIVSALDALIEAIVNFSQPQKGQLIKTMYAKVKLIESAACSKVLMMIESPEMSQALSNKLETEFQSALNNLSSPTSTS